MQQDSPRSRSSTTGSPRAEGRCMASRHLDLSPSGSIPQQNSLFAGKRQLPLLGLHWHFLAVPHRNQLRLSSCTSLCDY